MCTANRPVLLVPSLVQVNGRLRRLLVLTDWGCGMPDALLRGRYFNLGHKKRGDGPSIYSK
jgi:hypothetical protein